MWQVWLIIAGVCLVVEAMTVGFLIFWFAIGALIAMVVSLFVQDILIQSIVFLVSSSILVLCTRKLVNKFVKNKTVPTNVYGIVGKRGIVTLEVDSTKGTGQVKIDGEIWSAKCKEGAIIPRGTEIEIEKIDGVKAFVKTI